MGMGRQQQGKLTPNVPKLAKLNLSLGGAKAQSGTFARLFPEAVTVTGCAKGLRNK